MSLLSYTELCELVERGVITNVKPEQINGSSIDITVGDEFMFEERPRDEAGSIIDWSRRQKLAMRHTFASKTDGVILVPGQACLAHSEQVFNLPDDISCEYKLKSSMARTFIEHFNAGWCDPLWQGSVLTLELINQCRYHSIRIRPGDPIGQIVFFRNKPVPLERSYAVRGRYNNDKSVSAAKP